VNLDQIISQHRDEDQETEKCGVMYDLLNIRISVSSSLDEHSTF
jgi:hypothetical protein